MTDKLAEQLRLTPEEIVNLVWKQAGEWNKAVEKCFMVVAEAQLDKAFNTPIPIEGGVCPECGGWSHRVKKCPTCKGTGKLPITVREAIERVIG